MVGSGALGSVYAALLAREGATVTAISRRGEGELRVRLAPMRPDRDSQLAASTAIVIPKQSGVPASSTVVLLAVRLEQVNQALAQTLASVRCPMVALTPLFPDEEARIRRDSSAPVLPAMPSVAAHFVADDLRYLVAPLTKTWIDDAGAEFAAVRQLVAVLDAAGLATAFGSRVASRNHATTVTFFPACLALARAGSVRALSEDTELLRVTALALSESRHLARALGRVDFGMSLIAHLGSARALAFGFRQLLRRRPEVVDFLEQHFVHKLVQQNRTLGTQIAELFSHHGVECPAFSVLLDTALH